MCTTIQDSPHAQQYMTSTRWSQGIFEGYLSQRYFYFYLLFFSCFPFTGLIWFPVLCFCGISVCGNVCISVFICLLYFFLALSLLTVSLLYPIMFLFILSYIMLLFLDVCFCSNNREKERLWICVGGESGRSGKSWGRENHIHNIVYEKLFLSSQWIKGICY